MTAQELVQQCHQEVIKLPDSWQIVWLRLTGQRQTAWWVRYNSSVSWGKYRIYANTNGTYAPFIAGRNDTWIDKPHLLPVVMDLIKLFALDHGLQLD